VNPGNLSAGYRGSASQCGPSQRMTLHQIAGNGVTEHDFVDGGVLNNTPIHIAIDAGATHVISFELEPLRRHGTFMYLAP